MTWWLLLYSFSILARYEPRRWVKLLDRDSPKGIAVLFGTRFEEALPLCRSSCSRRLTKSRTCCRSLWPSKPTRSPWGGAYGL